MLVGVGKKVEVFLLCSKLTAFYGNISDLKVLRGCESFQVGFVFVKNVFVDFVDILLLRLSMKIINLKY